MSTPRAHPRRSGGGRSSSSIPRRMCAPHVRGWSKDGALSAAVFSMVNRHNETGLWYSLDNVSAGMLRPFVDWFGVEAAEQRRPPSVHACGERLAVRALGCTATTTGLHYPSTMCQLRFHQPRLCPVTLRWPRHHELGVSVPFCEPGSSGADADELPRVHVSACAPFFLNPDEGAAREATRRVQRWTEFMAASQVGRVHLHVLNRAAEVRPALLRDRRAALAASGALRVHFWDYFEEAHAVLAPASQFVRHHNRTWEAGYANPYHPYNLLYTKCLHEETASTEWMLIIDVDEYWKAVPRPPQPQLTISRFLELAPPELQRHHFCVLNERCMREWDGSVRPKSAVRIGGGVCTWLGSSHVSMPATRGQPDACRPLHSAAAPKFDWKAMTQACAAAARAPPAPFAKLPHYFSHYGERVGTGGGARCGGFEDDAAEWYAHG